VILPQNATLVTISTLPSDIATAGGRVHLFLGAGVWSMVYFMPAPSTNQTQPPSSPSFPVLWYAAGAAAVGALIVAVVLVRRRRTPFVLRPDDEKILGYVKSRGGKAYASDIVNSLGMPKSSVWKALRRLEENGMVKTRKDGNRVIVEA
jgi:uncharacterized membrane protein